MNNLITIKEQDNKQLISARELHEKLGINKRFTDWFKNKIVRLALIEGKDFIPFRGDSTVGRPTSDYNVTIDIAKHICMMSFGVKAQEVREYFIKVEEAWNDPMMILKRGRDFLEAEKLRLEARVIEMLPMEEFALAFKASESDLLIRDYAKSNGINLPPMKLYELLRQYGYTMSKGEGLNKPYAIQVKNGNFILSPRTVGKKTYYTTMITTRGQLAIYNKLKKEGIIE